MHPRRAAEVFPVSGLLITLLPALATCWVTSPPPPSAPALSAIGASLLCPVSWCVSGALCGLLGFSAFPGPVRDLGPPP